MYCSLILIFINRYACVVSVNLTLLCERYDGKYPSSSLVFSSPLLSSPLLFVSHLFFFIAQLFAAQDFSGKKLDTTLWRPMSVSEVPSHADNPRLYDAYNAGENLTDTVPHGCVGMSFSMFTLPLLSLLLLALPPFACRQSAVIACLQSR